MFPDSIPSPHGDDGVPFTESACQGEDEVTGIGAGPDCDWSDSSAVYAMLKSIFSLLLGRCSEGSSEDPNFWVT